MGMEYKYFRWTRQIVAIVGIVFGAGAIWHFVFAARESLKTTCNVAVIILWTLVPPLWFFGEYWLLEHGILFDRPPNEDKETFLKSIKDYADYASKIWAAVLAILILLYEVNTR
jgi:hypothetical protein